MVAEVSGLTHDEHQVCHGSEQDDGEDDRRCSEADLIGRPAHDERTDDAAEVVD